jgi:hypothetical protein
MFKRAGAEKAGSKAAGNRSDKKKRGELVDKRDRKELLAAYKERKVVGGICAVKNVQNGKMLLAAVADIQGYKNRFQFSQSNGECMNIKMQADWKKYGARAFVLEVLEEYEKKETQSQKEFGDDLKALKEIWLEKLDPGMLY